MVGTLTLNHFHGGNISEVAAKYGLKPEQIIDFSASINPLGLSPRAGAAIAKRLDSILHYPEQFSATLVNTLSEIHGLPAGSIIAGNGSTELIYLIPRVFRPKKALIVTPAFSEYFNSLSLAGCQVEMFRLDPEDDFRVDIDSLGNILGNEYDLLYMANPGNPSGALIPRATILAVADAAETYGTLFVLDEAFIDFVEEESVKEEAARRENLIVLRSLTKFYGMPGLRVGFAVGNAKNISRLGLYKEPWSVNTLGMIAAVESLADTGHADRTREYVSRERERLFSGLENIPGLRPYRSAANYILIRIERDGVDADTLFHILAGKGILIRSCTSFEGLGKGFFRVAVRTTEDNERLITAVKDVFVK